MQRQLDDWISAYMEYTEETEPPILYRKWVAVSVIAAALQRKCFIPLRGDMTWYPNFYIALVGPSGLARKGTAMSGGESFLRELGIRIASEAVTREALIREINESQDIAIDNDENAIPHSSLTVFSKELTVFLGYNNVQLMMDLTDWYDCADHWTYRTKNMGTDEIQGLWVNILGATTPKLIRTTLPDDAVGGGFTSRTIFVYEPQKGKIIVPWESSEDEGLRRKLMEDLDAIHNMIGKFYIDSEFSDAYVDFYHKIHEEPPVNDPLFTGYNQRRAHHTVKLAMVLSAAQSNDMVLTKKHFDEADKMLSETEKQMPRTFHGVGQGEAVEVTSAIMDFIAQKGKVTQQEIFQRFHKDLDNIRQCREIISALKNLGFVTSEVIGSSTQLKFNPKSEYAKIYGQDQNPLNNGQAE